MNYRERQKINNNSRENRLEGRLMILRIALSYKRSSVRMGGTYFSMTSV